MVRRVVLCQLDILIDRDLSRDKREVEELRHSEIEQQSINICQTLTTPPCTQHRLDELHLIIVLQQSLTEEQTSKALIILILEGRTDIIVDGSILFALAQSLLDEVLHDFYRTILQACTLISTRLASLIEGGL